MKDKAEERVAWRWLGQAVWSAQGRWFRDGGHPEFILKLVSSFPTKDVGFCRGIGDLWRAQKSGGRRGQNNKKPPQMQGFLGL